uniref:Uncharacterized protein n=1 Tax=Peronospora matthiolae TaxID=2874970 RepID=A0AAV1TI60_9STRA
MLASSFPVPWRDETTRGLHGVVNVQHSDFNEKDSEEILVRDVIQILNKKLESASSGTKLDEVTRIMLHGVRLSNDIPLNRFIPGLSGSSPRFVATTHTRTRGPTITIFVVTLSGKCISIDCSPTDAVHYAKSKIEDKEGMPRESQCLVYAGKQLKDHHPLSYYNVKDKCTLRMKWTLRGGFAGRFSTPRTFADVSDGSLITAYEFSSDAPEWRVCSRGLNIEGRCKNPDCRAFRRMIIDRKKFELFNLIEDDDVRCPICHWKVDPVACGLYDCCWRYEGIKESDGVSMCSTWKDAQGYVYHRFDCDENGGTVEWESLLITVKPRDDAESAKLLVSMVSAVVRPSDICTICWSPFSSSRKDSHKASRCGHTFHRDCSQKWTKWCKRNNTRFSCPICRKTE